VGGIKNAPPFLKMSVRDSYKALLKLLPELEQTIIKTIQDNAGLYPELIREQLHASIDGDGKSLSPTYLDDPFFKKKGRWKGRNKGYAAFKNKVTPPQSGRLLGLTSRTFYRPNLTIKGVFHASIQAKPIKNGVNIAGYAPFAADIERKYGKKIFKLLNEAKEYFVKTKLLPAVQELYNKHKT
jgi:hypothetical protein